MRRKWREIKRGKESEWLREGLKPTTWQMACHALTNWATESPGNSVTEFEYLRLSCLGSSRSGYPTDTTATEKTVENHVQRCRISQCGEHTAVAFLCQVPALYIHLAALSTMDSSLIEWSLYPCIWHGPCRLPYKLLTSSTGKLPQAQVFVYRISHGYNYFQWLAIITSVFKVVWTKCIFLSLGTTPLRPPRVHLMSIM